MAFVFRKEKNLETIPIKNREINYKTKILKEIRNMSQFSKLKYESLNNSSIPFLSNTEKFLEKTEETPGPGSYNIDNSPDNFIHKQYIKSNIDKYKDSLYDFYSILKSIDLKSDIKSTPGPGEYNPGKYELFGEKIKKKKKNKINKSYSLYNEFPNIDIFKKIMNKKKYKKRQISDEKENNNSNNKGTICDIKKDKRNLSKRVQSYTIKELFTNLILNQKIRNKNYENIISSSPKDLNFINDINNSMNKSQRNLIKNDNSFFSQTSISNSNIFNKSKIFKNKQILEKMKETILKTNFKITTELQESNYYLNEFINSKYFSQNPGPGYYFYKPIKNEQKPILNYSHKSHSMPTSNKKNLIKNDLCINEEIKKVNKNDNIKKSKSFYELQSDIIKQNCEKEKKNFTKNKRFLLLNDLMKLMKLKEKINEKENNNILYENINNNKEIQEYNYPNNKNKNLNKSSDNIKKNPNNMEVKFQEPFGYQNEIYKNDNPGPGQYQIFYSNSIFKRNEEIIEKYSFNKDDKKNFKERKLFFDEIKNTNPPVGIYQTQFYNTIGFNNLMTCQKFSENPIRNGFLERIKAITERKVKEMKIKENKSKSMLGPFSYFKNYDKKNQKIYNKNICFGSKSEKNIKLTKKNEVGPGDYNIDLNTNWIKKTYNVLFV